MHSLTHQALTHLASAQTASDVMRSYVNPTMVTLCGLASLFAVFFIVIGGIRYITSSGNPEKLYQAKRILQNALIGLVVIISAATLTGILNHAYSGARGGGNTSLPPVGIIEPEEKDESTSDVIWNAISGIFRKIINVAAKPFLGMVGYFTNETPLMANNPQVFNIWLVIVAITDVLFVIVVALLGFHIMSFQSLGFDEIDIKQMLPQLALSFILINTSIFAIDAVIGLSNAMINALKSGFPVTEIWDSLSKVTEQAFRVGMVGLLLMGALLIMLVMLIVYYLGRLISLYLGAILSPLIILLWLLPTFKDFAIAALKTYLTLIFVLFVHVVILMLASSIFVGVYNGINAVTPSAYVSLFAGMATVLALLKTQGFMQELTYAASTPRAARELGNQFVRSMRATEKSIKLGTKTAGYIKEHLPRRQKNGEDPKSQTGTGSGSKGSGKTSTNQNNKIPTGKTIRAENVRKK